MGNLPRDGSAIAVGPGSGGAMADGTAPACMELDAADSLLDSRDMDCSAYTGNEADCGMFDDADFEADYLCCACGGGAHMLEESCANLKWNDMQNDSVQLDFVF